MSYPVSFTKTGFIVTVFIQKENKGCAKHNEVEYKIERH